MQAMHEDSHDEDNETSSNQRVEWETAVTHELEELYNKQSEIEAQIEILQARAEQDSPTLNVNRRNAFESDVDALADLINPIKRDHEEKKREFRREIAELKWKAHNLETQKGTAAVQIEDLTAIRDYVTRQIDEFEISQDAKLKELAKSSQTTRHIQNTTKFKMEVPKFKGTELERPIKFLSELEKYNI